MAKLEEEKVGKLLLEIKGLGRNDFRRAYAHPFLLREVPRGRVLPEPTPLSAGHMSRLLGQFDAEPDPTPPASLSADVDRYLVRIKRATPLKPGDSLTLGTDGTRALCVGGELARGVSPRQTRFTLAEGGQWFIADEKSSYGTYVNGTRVPPFKSVPIADADQIQFGTVLRYRFFTPSGLFSYLRFCAMLARVAS